MGTRRLVWSTLALALAIIVASAVVGALAAARKPATLHAPKRASVATVPAVSHAPARTANSTLAALRARWPVRGPVNSTFGSRASFWGRRAHSGVDIGARRGTPVRVPESGTVAFAGWRSGYGRTVIIDHGGKVQSLYGHLSQVSVRRNQSVSAGSPIGLTGATGNASGPHLHYEVLVAGRPVDPRERAPGSSRPRTPPPVEGDGRRASR